MIGCSVGSIISSRVVLPTFSHLSSFKTLRHHCILLLVSLVHLRLLSTHAWWVLLCACLVYVCCSALSIANLSLNFYKIINIYYKYFFGDQGMLLTLVLALWTQYSQLSSNSHCYSVPDCLYQFGTQFAQFSEFPSECFWNYPFPIHSHSSSSVIDSIST